MGIEFASTEPLNLDALRVLLQFCADIHTPYSRTYRANLQHASDD